MSLLTKFAAGCLMSVALAGAQATTLYAHDFNKVGLLQNPGSLTASFSAQAGGALLSLELAGFGSLDGAGSWETDVFGIELNGKSLYAASFNLGGGGSNTVWYAPSGSTSLVTTNGATDDLHDSKQTTWSGGTVQISLPVALRTGANTLEFSYLGLPQGFADERWGINQVTVIAAPVPEPGRVAMMLAGLVGIGFLAWRRGGKR